MTNSAMKKKLEIEFQYFSTCPQASLLKYRLYEAVNELNHKVDFNIKVEECKCYTNAEFFKTLGGYVSLGLILIPNLKDILNELESRLET